MADGTAQQCGRVGSCHIYLKKPFRNERLFYWGEGRFEVREGLRGKVLAVSFWLIKKGDP
jgi:hypothetical protein